ncbi:MAG: Arm DNA-binding domain-containing protein [Lactobacillales bacterium]|jgi:hypothetical protein|nr:Arm DNA-binding domain-containing protein [Lactobacillales bacterium]
MAQIESYKKNGKILYKVKNLYVGKNEITGKFKYKNKAGFKTKKETQLWISQTLLNVEKNGISNEMNDIETFEELYHLFLEHQRTSVKSLLSVLIGVTLKVTSSHTLER